ncbi:lytic polysaccharide monooxygenase [Marinicella meishanensis]|uniref:lytic polysaccharide monooxygenase n=1 Tax=Marinicella meishanensis TaxID=2873263 RepID=UPI001CBD52E3|nr:lytic polysaccharide monooxygenase [Marinicella sp. NBU2979]
MACSLSTPQLADAANCGGAQARVQAAEYRLNVTNGQGNQTAIANAIQELQAAIRDLQLCRLK